MSTKLFHSIYSYTSKLGCDRPMKNLLEEIKNKIRKIDIFSAIYINIEVVTTTNSKLGLQRSLQNLMLDFSRKKKSQIGQEFSSENDFEPRFSISLHCAPGLRARPGKNLQNSITSESMIQPSKNLNPRKKKISKGAKFGKNDFAFISLLLCVKKYLNNFFATILVKKSQNPNIRNVENFSCEQLFNFQKIGKIGVRCMSRTIAVKF